VHSPGHYDCVMPTITTFLTFDTQAGDAATFYTSIFPNSKIVRRIVIADLEKAYSEG